MKRSIIIELNGDIPPKGEGVTVEAYGRGGVSERDMHAAVFCLIREIAGATGESKMEAMDRIVKEMAGYTVSILED